MTKVLAVVLVILIATAAVAAINHSRLSPSSRDVVAELWCPNHGYTVWELVPTGLWRRTFPGNDYSWYMVARCVECLNEPTVGNQ